MGTELTVTQQKAIGLREYMNSDRVKPQIAAALPKWLTPDRFLRVVFGATMRNPKLVECSLDSMLQSVMMCAQLGLEPILGRAYLIPYNNSKQVNGKWTKVMECQFQPGYQGLVDLARRSGTIADVWGACVYSNDEFTFSYGMERDLVHKPWFTDPAKAEAGEPGRFIGAYAVWQLRDGTKHPSFLPAFEIFKRRAKSQSWDWAENGDKAKGGGKKDSVWHQWFDDMALKTVLKHSAKLVPASIEFMSAVTVDDAVETGRRVSMYDGIAMLDATHGAQALPPGDNGGGEVIDTDLEDRFRAAFADELAGDKPGVESRFLRFVEETATTYKMSTADAKAKFLDQVADVKAGFAAWVARTYPSGTKAPAGETKAAPPETTAPDHDPNEPDSGKEVGNGKEDAFRAEWINLKPAGFGKYVERNLERFKAASPWLREEAVTKWAKFYQGYACPIASATEAPTEAPAEAQGQEQPRDEGRPQEATNGQASSPQDVQRQKIIEEIKRYPDGVQMEAKRRAGCSIMPSQWPPSLEGCARLLDMVNTVAEEHGKK